jgi:hypothetical protein
VGEGRRGPEARGDISNDGKYPVWEKVEEDRKLAAISRTTASTDEAVEQTVLPDAQRGARRS